MPGEDRARLATRSVLWGFALLTVLFSGVFPPFSNPNELSRFQTVVAAADHGTFAIDPVLSLGNHEDKSISGGRTFSNKAPGLALAAIPVYRALRLGMTPPAHGTSDEIFRVLRLSTVSLVCLLALTRFACRLGRMRGIPAGATPLVVAGVALGTPYLFYARSFFAHAWTAALLFLSWDAIRIAEERGPSRRIGTVALGAGFLAGWAAISEYPAALVAFLLLLRALAARPVRSAAFFVIGLAIPIALLGVYDTICFGAPWILSSSREAYPEYSRLAATGLFGFGPPNGSVAAAYLVHPARGLLLLSPFFIWAVPGFVRWLRLREERADCLFALAATVVFFAAMTGYPNWQGGWSLGDRYLLPIVFFPALALGRALESPWSRGLFAAAVIFSAAVHALLASSWPYFPEDLAWPESNGSAWFLARGWVAPGMLSGLPVGFAAALAVVLLCVAAPLALAVRAAAPSWPRPALCALIGLAPLAAILLRAPDPSFGGRLWRAAIYGAYSGRDPSRDELRRTASSASTPEEQRQAVGAWRVYGPR